MFHSIWNSAFPIKSKLWFFRNDYFVRACLLYLCRIQYIPIGHIELEFNLKYHWSLCSYVTSEKYLQSLTMSNYRISAFLFDITSNNEEIYILVSFSYISHNLTFQKRTALLPKSQFLAHESLVDSMKSPGISIWCISFQQINLDLYNNYCCFH